MYVKTLFAFADAIGDTYLFKSMLDAWQKQTGARPQDTLVVLGKRGKLLIPVLFDQEGWNTLVIDTEAWHQAVRSQNEAELHRLTADLLVQIGRYGTFDRLIHCVWSAWFPWDRVLVPALSKVDAAEKLLYVMYPGSPESLSVIYPVVESYAADGLYHSIKTVPLVVPDTLQLTPMLEILGQILEDFCPGCPQFVPPPITTPVRNPENLPSSYVLVNLGSSSNALRMSIYETTRLVSRIAGTGRHVVLTGGGAEDLNDQTVLMDHYRYRGGDLSLLHPMVNRLALEDVLSLLPYAECIVTADTGIAHLAQGMGCKKVLVMTKPRSAWHFFPYPRWWPQRTARVLWAQMDCPHCSIGTSIACPYWYAVPLPCHAAVTADDAWAAMLDWVLCQEHVSPPPA